MTTNSNLTRIARIVLLFLISVILLTCLESTLRIYDNDIWFHLEYGKHFSENNTWSIDHTAYSWTPTQDWTYVTWIGSSAIYAIYKYTSINALMMLPFLTLVAILLLYIFFLRSIGSSYSLITMALFFIAAVFFYLPLVKPAVFTTFLFATCLAIFYSTRHNRHHAYWTYPLIFLLWVNTHGGFIFGLFFLSFALVIELIIAWRKRTFQSEKAYLQGFGAALLLSYLVLGINPEGYSYLTTLAQQLLHVGGINPASYISEFGNLWSNLDPTKYYNIGKVGMGWAGVFMLASYMLLALTGARMGRRADFVSILLLIVFFVMGLLVMRLFVFYCLVWLFSITWLITAEQPVRSSGRLTLITFVLMCYFVANQANLFMLDGNLIKPFKHNIALIYPVKAIDFLKQKMLPAQLIHDYGTGGYLIWALYPEYKVFMDPRGGPYRSDVMTDCLALERSTNVATVRAILDKYPDARTAVFQLSSRTLSQNFMKLRDWRLIYFDENMTIFVRTDSPQSNIRVELAPNRFADLNDPRVLMNLFSLYQDLGSHESMRMIRDYYQANVSPHYLYKISYLVVLDSALNAVH